MSPSNTLTNYRAAIRDLVVAMNEARNLELIITSQGGAATMFEAGDFAGSNADVDEAELIAAISSRQAIESLVTANGNAHLTNLNRMLA